MWKSDSFFLLFTLWIFKSGLEYFFLPFHSCKNAITESSSIWLVRYVTDFFLFSEVRAAALLILHIYFSIYWPRKLHRSVRTEIANPGEKNPTKTQSILWKRITSFLCSFLISDERNFIFLLKENAGYFCLETTKYL